MTRRGRKGGTLRLNMKFDDAVSDFLKVKPPTKKPKKKPQGKKH